MMRKQLRWKPSILLVEDDPLTSGQLGDLLQDCCRLLHVAGNAEQGLNLYLEARSDIVITDILMPGMSGLDMAGRIRQIDPLVPIIVITACSDRDHFGSRGNPFDDLILKPVDVDHLLNVISRWSERLQARQDQH